MANCAKLAAGIVFDCPPDVAGIEAEAVVVFNFDDIDKDLSTLVKTQLQSISLAGSPTPLGYSFEGTNNSVDANWENVEDGFNPNKFNHILTYRGFTNDPSVVDTICDMPAGNFIVFAFLKSKRVRVFGWDVGLRAIPAQNFKEEDGATIITFQTRSEEFESCPPLTYVGSGSPTPTFAELKAQILALT